ncbi:hypothetical protein HYY75_11775, partial [bacterium]|nr:hypothetical protein [bacterium]
MKPLKKTIRNYQLKFRHGFLVYLFFILPPLFAINAPTITKVQNVGVVPGQTRYINSTSNILFEGNAEAGVTVRLYRNGSQVGSTVSDAIGKWNITLASLSEGSYNFDADATDGIFDSTKSAIAVVMTDVTPPSISYAHWDDRDQGFGDGSVVIGHGEFRGSAALKALVSDGASGMDFSTMQMTLYDVTISQLVPAGPLTTDNVYRIFWKPPSGVSWGTAAEIHAHRYRIWAKIADRAGNFTSTTIECTVDLTRPPPPTLKKVYDPAHHLFTGSGEPTSNLPDGGGWVDYYANMTISTNPTKTKGIMTPYSVPYGSGGRYEADRVGVRTYRTGCRCVWVDASGNWETGFLDLAPFGNTYLSGRSREGRECGWCGCACWPVKFETGVPPTPAGTSVNPCNRVRQKGDYKLPDWTVTLQQAPFSQTAQLIGCRGCGAGGGWYWMYSRLVLPSGQSYVNTPGVYDAGEAFRDYNGNGIRETNEEFLDDNSKGVSDGQTAFLPNFMNLQLSVYGRHCFRVFSINAMGQSPCICARFRAVTNETYKYYLKQCDVYPNPGMAYRRTANKPNQLVIQSFRDYEQFICCSLWWLDTSLSKVRIYNGLGNELIPPTTGSGWNRLGSFKFQTTLDTSATIFPDATYYVEVKMQDNWNTVINSSTSFKVDNVAPLAQDMVPPDGALSNSFTSFNAKVVDPALGDTTAGSGPDINVANPQIWPFKQLVTPKSWNSDAQERTFTAIDDISGVSVDHRGTSLPLNTPLEAWEIVGGIFQPNPMTGIITSNGSGKLKVNVAPSSFLANKTYAILYPIPFFTSNDGIERIGAVPVSPITADGTFVSKVVTLDKAGNMGNFFATTSPCKIPVGTIGMTASPTFAIAGLIPADCATFTSTSIRARDNSFVLDGQTVSLVKSPSNLGLLVPADVNGVPGDGHQVAVGANGAPTGVGKFSCGVQVPALTTGNVSIFAVIGLASGTSAPTLPIYLIDPFSISPASTTLSITPGNPNPSTKISSTVLGYSTRKVPNGSLATWTYVLSNSDPTAGMLSQSGLSSFNSSACLDDSANSAWH